MKNALFWALFGLLFVSEAGYMAIPDDDFQAWVSWDVVQWQIVIIAVIGYMAHSYQDTFRKAAMLLVVLWGLYIALTDHFIPNQPLWLGAAEAAVFIMWGLHARWQIQKRQSLPEARHGLRDIPGNADREGGE